MRLSHAQSVFQQMERFKACEKEMKTKAFSKEGLNAQAKLDPREQLKVETSGWVSGVVDELGRQMEHAEAEIESLRGGGKRKKDQRSNERVLELESLNDRRKWHVSRLEIILRLLENGNLDPDRVTSLRDDINYFVETNTVKDNFVGSLSTPLTAFV
jgi:CCR4-NOT transcription complex subunit 3